MGVTCRADSFGQSYAAHKRLTGKSFENLGGKIGLGEAGLIESPKGCQYSVSVWYISLSQDYYLRSVCYRVYKLTNPRDLVGTEAFVDLPAMAISRSLM